MIRKIQRTKKWFKPKKVNKLSNSYQIGNYHYTDDDSTYTNFTSYGGYNHTNRDRKGGHLNKNYTKLYDEDRHLKEQFKVNNKFHINEGLQDYLDEEFDKWIDEQEQYFLEQDNWYNEDYFDYWDTEIPPKMYEDDCYFDEYYNEYDFYNRQF